VAIVPCLALSFLWLAANSGEVAAWRMIDRYGVPAEQFDLAWKIRFMWANPLHFPTVLVASLGNIGELWRQLIGVLGWLDTPLRPWIYPAASVAVLATCLRRLELDWPARRRIAIMTALTVLGYCLAVYLIFFLAWTPVDWGRIEGVQGRYFVVCLPPAALLIAALLNRGLSHGAIAVIAVCGAILGGGATVEALLRVDWKMF